MNRQARGMTRAPFFAFPTLPRPGRFSSRGFTRSPRLAMRGRGTDSGNGLEDSSVRVHSLAEARYAWTRNGLEDSSVRVHSLAEARYAWTRNGLEDSSVRVRANQRSPAMTD